VFFFFFFFDGKQQHSKEMSTTDLGMEHRTLTERTCLEDSTVVNNEHSCGMGPRAHTISEGVEPDHLVLSFADNYSLHLRASGHHAKIEKLDRHRLATLRKPLGSPAEEALLRTPFETWRSVERSQVPGWRCSVQSPVYLSDLVPFGSQDILAKVSVYRGSVISLGLDAIVNAANESCLGGGGVDGAIHDAAGPLMFMECCSFNGCATGQTRLTKGYNLPARFVLHTVGPIGERPRELGSCYHSALALARHHRLRSVGFCCISTGIFGYPLAAAAKVALTACLSVLNEHRDDFDMVAFACFRREEEECYRSMMPKVYREVLTRRPDGEGNVTTEQKIDSPH
jgi:O-acetyl-ADP-ribose deacetylase (regulator of RNase III)